MTDAPSGGAAGGGEENARPELSPSFSLIQPGRGPDTRVATSWRTWADAFLGSVTSTRPVLQRLVPDPLGDRRNGLAFAYTTFVRLTAGWALTLEQRLFPAMRSRAVSAGRLSP